MNPFTRRHFLKSSASALGAFGAALSIPGGLLQQRLNAAIPSAQNKKMIFIFQRGGNDGINTILPRGDRDYNNRTRPTLFIPEDDAIDLGNGFAQLHPRLEPLMEIYNQRRLNGVSGPGNLALIHRVGYAGQSRSHFSSQQFWENGVPGNDGLEQGMIYRLLEKAYDLENADNPLVAAGIDGRQFVSLKGQSAIPNFNRAANFRFRGSDQLANKFLGRAPSSNEAVGSGLMGLFGDTPDYENKTYRDLVHGTGQIIGASMDTVQAAAAQGPNQPLNGANYPNNNFGRKLQEAALLMKRTDIKCVGVDIGGWDNHERQGQIFGRHGSLLNDVGRGIQALSRDLEAEWENLIILTMTEFGRTSRENNSRGTDHAEATTMFIAGGGVRGGVYNCDEQTWENNAMFKVRDRYLSHKTDFRSIFAEIFKNHFDVPDSEIAEVIPGYEVAAEDDPNAFHPLGFMR